MKSIVLYWYPNLSSKRHTVNDVPIIVARNIIGYVRTELHDNDAAGALDNAKPMTGETVLNSVEIE